MGSSNDVITPPVDSSGFFRRLFKWSATYRPDEPRMSRWWWILFVFLPPITLFIVWRDKKFLKQMALITFYLGIFFILLRLLNMTHFISTTDYEPSWRLVILIGITASAFFLAVYAQHAIIKTEKRIRDRSDSDQVENI